MNDTMQQIFARRSVRAYEDRPIPEAEKRLILEADRKSVV